METLGALVLLAQWQTIKHRTRQYRCRPLLCGMYHMCYVCLLWLCGLQWYVPCMSEHRLMFRQCFGLGMWHISGMYRACGMLYRLMLRYYTHYVKMHIYYYINILYHYSLNNKHSHLINLSEHRLMSRYYTHNVDMHHTIIILILIISIVIQLT